MSTGLKIMVVAGEASGDTHAAKLVNAIRELRPERSFEFFGSAGTKMRSAGVDPIVDSDRLSVVGLAEIAAVLPMFVNAYRSLTRAARERRPDVVILVDFPEFNIKLARSLKRSGFKVVYYISPQLWAWRKYRIESVKKNIDLMLTILPFEKQWYEQNGFSRVEYVGSPLAREVHTSRGKEIFCRDHRLDPSKPLIALLPGSREKEITRILPVMLETAHTIRSRRPEIQFVLCLSSEANLPIVEGLRAAGPDTGMTTVVNETYDALNASDAAAVTSGTATLEAGILGTPMVVVYKTSGLNYRLFEPIIDVEHYGLINLIAGKRLAKEFIQHEFNADALSSELLRLLETEVNQQMREDLKTATDTLGHGGASKRAAEAILRCMDESV
jgi:lipid-A-disaccharide synthase